MIIILKAHSTKKDLSEVKKHVRERGYEPHTIQGAVQTVVAAIGDETTHSSLEQLVNLPMVEKVMPVQQKYKLISREAHPENATVDIDGVEIGGDTFRVIAGPCAIESQDQISKIAQAIKESGASLLRGGAFKPRTSPYSFQGYGEEALEMMRQAKAESGLPLVSELVRESDLEIMSATVDMLQIGARNALNYALLETAADSGKPILLKRGMSATIQEWLLAAEYIVKRGNRNVVLCARGIRTFETATRNTLDLSGVAIAKQESCLPVIVDPSHAAGRRDMIEPLAKAAIAVGADGLLVEAHPNPENALSDTGQQLNPTQFAEFMKNIRPFVELTGRKL